MESITKCLATNIRNLRKELNLTQTELAEKAGISMIFLQGIESEKKWVSPMTAKVLAQALKVHESRLFENCFQASSKISNQIALKKAVKPLKKPRLAKLNHIPDDVFIALSTTCRHPKWKWELFRWILEGYKRDVQLAV